jgi:hypothetical protein
MSTAESYGACPIKRQRRTKGEITRLRDDLFSVLEAQNPMTVRQAYYQMVAAGRIEKTEQQYKAICRLLVEMRRDGQIPYGWITDATRWMRKPTTYTSLGGMLDASAQFYRRALWDDQPAYVEIWLEKNALAGVISEVTRTYDVPLMVSVGFSSVTYLHSAAESISNIGKPTFIYQIGDHDPSGVAISKKIESGLRGFAPRADITFKRIAVTPEQIEQYKLVTRPTKKTDSRARKSGIERSVEVDALPPAVLKAITTQSIEQHIDEDILLRTQIVEIAERETLEAISKSHHQFQPTWWKMRGDA